MVVILIVSMLVFMFMLFWITGAIVTVSVYKAKFASTLGFYRSKVNSGCLVAPFYFVVRGPGTPLAIHWLGGTTSQYNKVADAIVNKQLPFKKVTDCVVSDWYRDIFKLDVVIWPTREIKELLGKPSDLCPED